MAGNLRHRDPCNKESMPFLWILSPSWFEETGRSHKISFDAYPLARSLLLFLFQNHPPSWGFLSRERHLSTRVLTHQRVGKKRTGRSGSCKAKEYLFPGDWTHPHPLLCNRKNWQKRFRKWKKVNEFTTTFVVVESKDAGWLFFSNGQISQFTWVGELSRVWCQLQIVPVVEVGVCLWRWSFSGCFEIYTRGRGSSITVGILAALSWPCHTTVRNEWFLAVEF